MFAHFSVCYSILPQLKLSSSTSFSATAGRKFENLKNTFSQSATSSTPPTQINNFSDLNNIQCNSNLNLNSAADFKRSLFSRKGIFEQNLKMDKSNDANTLGSKENANGGSSSTENSVRSKAVMLEGIVQERRDGNLPLIKTGEIFH